MRKITQYLKAHPAITSAIGTAVAVGVASQYGPQAGAASTKVLGYLCALIGAC